MSVVLINQQHSLSLPCFWRGRMCWYFQCSWLEVKLQFFWRVWIPYFFEKWWSNSPVCWQSNPPPTTGDFSKVYPFVTLFIHMEISYQAQPKFLSLRKLSLRCLFSSIKLFISESLHLTPFTGFSKGSLMSQQNSEYRSNDPWSWCILCTMWKELQNPSACDADQNFHSKVQCPLDKFPNFHCKEKNSSQMPGNAWGWGWGWAILELTGTLPTPSQAFLVLRDSDLIWYTVY